MANTCLFLALIGRFGFNVGDKQMYIFDVTTGKLIQQLDETKEAYETLFEKEMILVDSFHFAKRIKLETSIQEKVSVLEFLKSRLFRKVFLLLLTACSIEQSDLFSMEVRLV